MDDDVSVAAPAAGAWNRDLDWTAGSDEAPKRRGRAMAEQGSGAKREDRRHPATTLGQQGVADGVDATVKQVETAPCEASLDGALVEAKLVQLGPGNHPVLPPRKRRERMLPLARRRWSVQFGLVFGPNCTGRLAWPPGFREPGRALLPYPAKTTTAS